MGPSIEDTNINLVPQTSTPEELVYDNFKDHRERYSAITHLEREVYCASVIYLLLVQKELSQSSHKTFLNQERLNSNTEQKKKDVAERKERRKQGKKDRPREKARQVRQTKGAQSSRHTKTFLNQGRKQGKKDRPRDKQGKKDRPRDVARQE